MPGLTADELLPLPLYERLRPRLRPWMLEVKARRRVELAGFWLQFECRATVRYHLHEVLRLVPAPDPALIAEELRLAAASLAGPGSLACSAYLHEAPAEQRVESLRLLLDDGRAVAPVPADGDRGCVRALRFATGARQPVALACDGRVQPLPAETRRALAGDLGLRAQNVARALHLPCALRAFKAAGVFARPQAPVAQVPASTGAPSTRRSTRSALPAANALISASS